MPFGYSTTWAMTASVTFEVYLRAVQFFKGGNNLPRGHAFGVQTQDFIVQRGKTGLVLADQLRLKAAVPVTRDIDLELAVLRF